MNKSELRAALLLSGIYISRMLGLFLIFPTFSALAQPIDNATPEKIGLALGIYGLAQALLQIPAGWLSDVIGRKKVLALGLCLFFLGSVLAASSNDIDLIIWGRFLQGTGAISAVCLAYVGDSIRSEHQPKAMMIIGMAIGGSFMLAFILGAFISEHWGLSGLFTTTAILALCAMGFAYLLPTPPQQLTIFRFSSVYRTLKNKPLFTVNCQILVLHMLLSASFFLIPILLAKQLPDASKTIVYVIPLLITAVCIAPFMRRRDDASTKIPLFWLVFICALVVFATFPVFQEKMTFIAVMSVFFCGFTLLETLLPVLLLRRADKTLRGMSSGVYSLFQFMGSFIGGILGAKCYALWATNDTIQLSFYILALPAVLMMVVSLLINQQQRKVAHGEQRS